MRVPHPIPYQGSKRNLAPFIMSFFPKKIDTLFEPFAGSAAVSLAAAAYGKCSHFHLNDINEPLMALWKDIIYCPEIISDNYAKLWHEQKGKEREYYDSIREEFNKTKRTDYFLYLLARCVKASIRYNSNGGFNQSPDNRRKGRNPETMREDIFAASNLFIGRTTLTSKDYREILKSVSKSDLVYMDPPYQGTCYNRDPRYYSGINFQEFILALEDLRDKEISFILSYDGRLGEKKYGEPLPLELDLYRIEVEAGRSTQATLLGRDHITYESLYLSRALVNRLDFPTNKLATSRSKQLTLVA